MGQFAEFVAIQSQAAKQLLDQLYVAGASERLAESKVAATVFANLKAHAEALPASERPDLATLEVTAHIIELLTAAQDGVALARKENLPETLAHWLSYEKALRKRVRTALVLSKCIGKLTFERTLMEKINELRKVPQ